jgi:hypothetical protein
MHWLSLLYLLLRLLHVSALICHLQGASFILMSVFVGFSRIFLLRILIFKGLTARRLYKSFGIKGLTVSTRIIRYIV